MHHLRGFTFISADCTIGGYNPPDCFHALVSLPGF
ncbi:hypothetical protein NC653_012255 [Populus alba x Populus x berolinensis]|uniref:Uncharacterized protein n=1 Tax=Populus alba x Populus x berolinensis TaxID=444605 RepID=A0AAD6R4N4_9ROSI|nr:hypothetical protein NC653_012255 [Populus alba x Populus x berolinensis]